MLYVGSDRPVDPLTIAASRAIDNAARTLNLPYFLAGAMARDILLTHVYGINTGLATIDVDFGVAVDGWDEFKKIKTCLLETGLFNAAEKIEHRIYYRPAASKSGYPIDIIPFRGVETTPRTIAWPPERKIIMSVIGYEEALAAAEQVKIDDTLTVPIASLPGLALLKLFAWQDRHAETPKDALDIAMLFRHYSAAGNQDRLFNDEMPLLEAVEFDHDLASPRLLGKDVRQIVTAATLEAAAALLNNAVLMDRLRTHMSPVFKSADDNIAAAARLLEQFKIELTQEKI
jgi:predicted nucleotidyltransferase